MHWAINDWQLPPQQSWPAGTQQASLHISQAACLWCMAARCCTALQVAWICALEAPRQDAELLSARRLRIQ